MERLTRFTRTSVGRAAIGFVGTAAVLLGTPLLAPESAATMPMATRSAAAM